MNRVLQLLLVQMCMVLNSFQIKSFCRVWESNYRTSLPLVASDRKSQTEAGMETTPCFPFPGRTGTGLSLSPVWLWQAPFLPGSWGNRCPNKRKQVSDCCSTLGMDQHQDSVQTVWPTQLAEELHLPLDNPLGNSAWKTHCPERCRAPSRHILWQWLEGCLWGPRCP